MKTTNQLPGDVVAGTGAKSELVAHFENAWADVYNAPSTTEATKEIMKGLDMRAEELVRGVPFGGTWKLDKRKKIMVAALVASHIVMRTEADLEKYATCGSGTMCLHFPSFFGDDNNKAYGLGETVTSDYKGLVVTKYPGAKRDRLHLMSPCKTDLLVEAHGADGFCKCEELYNTEKVYYKVQKVRCMAKGLSQPVPINADGTCPEKYTYAGTEYEVEMESDDFYTHLGDETFSCDPDEDQEACIYKFMHVDGCTDDADTPYDDCLHDVYRDCYHETKDYCGNNPEPLLCDGDGNCVGVSTSPYPVPLSNKQDTFAEPINLKEHVTVDNSDEPITVCKNGWASDFLGAASTLNYKPCVSVAYDVVSMRGYSKDGFGMNYCAENKADFNDKLEKTCFWGGIVGSVAVSAFSGGVTGTVIVPVAIGSSSVACEKIMNMKSKWPQDQHQLSSFTIRNCANAPFSIPICAS